MSLVAASTRGDLAEVKRLLTHGSGLNETDTDGDTGLHCAAANNHAEVMRYLLRKAADVHKRGQHGRTPLMYAAMCKESSEPCDILLKAGARIDDVDNGNQSTALLLACELGIVDTVTLLLNKGADVSKRDRTGYQAIHRAAQSSPDIIDIILSHGGGVYSVTSDNGFSALHCASEEGKVDNMEKLIECGAAVNAKKIGGATPLFYAVSFKQSHAAQVLLRNGADVNMTKDGGYSPLLRACGLADMTTVRLLMRNKADANIATTDGRTPLHVACENANIVLVRLLLLHSDPDCPTQRGETPLLMATKKGAPEICRILLDTGDVDVDSCDIDGNTILHHACQAGYPEIVKMLLTKKVRLVAKNAERDTALVLAAKQRKVDCVKAIGHHIMTANLGRSLAEYSGSGARRFAPNMAADSILDTPDETLIQFILENKDRYNL